jgi:DNA-binding transcriptional LysR family regulator
MAAPYADCIRQMHLIWMPSADANLAGKPHLDLNLLETVAALFDEGSVSAAAVKLGLSQPAVSSALARLRKHFDDPLFVRTPRGVSPTPRGTEIATVAKDLLAQVREKLGRAAVFEPRLAHSAFTFALSDVGEIVFLPKLVEALGRLSPGTMVRSVSMPPDRLAQGLREGEVDLAVGHFPDLRGNDFFQQALFTHHFVCLLRADHPVQGRRLTMSEFLAMPHAVVQSEGRSQEIFEAHLEANGFARRVAVVTPHFLSIPKLIARSDCIVTVPHAMGIAYGRPEFGLKAMGLPFPSPRIELCQRWHRKMHKDARNVWLRRLVKDLFNYHTDEWQPTE